MEDAAVLLQDFVGSIDNLPHEVAFLLSEIAYKENRVEDLRTKISNRDGAIQKLHKSAGLMHEGPKEPTQLAKCRSDFAKAQALSQEKVALAERGVRLLTRHMNRLNTELNKLQGVQPFTVSANFGTQVLDSVVPMPASLSPMPVLNTPPVNDSSRKRKALAAIDTAAAAAHRGMSPTPQAYSAMHSQSMAQSNAMSAASARPHRPSRLSSTFAGSPPAYNRALSPVPNPPKRQRTSTARRGNAYDDMDAEGEDEDAEGEDVGSSEFGAEAAGDDQTPYCICQKPSYGEMVGCDNGACRFEWFHMSCVGLSKPPAGQWYCPMCTEALQQRSGTPLSANTGTGRRKR